MKIKTRILVQLAVLIALSIILTRFASFRFFIGPVEGIRIGFGSFPIILAGILYGPVAGGIVGILADLLGFALDPMKNVFLPQITAIAAIHGIMPVLILRLLKKEQNFGMGSCLLAVGLEHVLTSMVLMPLVLQSAFGIPVLATMLPRAISALIQIPLYSGLLILLVRRLRALFVRTAH